MTADANAVNIETRRYHHGDLRAALLAAALQMLKEHDAQPFSLREVARKVGVSPTAVYRHFPDKSALMDALAAEGLDRLAAAQREAASASGGGAAGFAATGRAYVRFALANPALFRLIFGQPARSGAGQALASDNAAMNQLRAQAAATGSEENGVSGRIREVKAWALVHGLALLMLDGQIAPDEALIDRVVEASP